MYQDTAYEVKIESEEDGFHLILKNDALDLDINVQQIAEELYAAVKREIGPWLYERDQARAERTVVRRPDLDDHSGKAYDISDSKHPDFHSVHADIWDARADK